MQLTDDVYDGLVGGSEKAQTAFYRQHRDAVFAFILTKCARNNCIEDAEEITNDAFLRVFRLAKTGRLRQKNPRATLCVIARGKAIDFYRVRRNRYDIHNDSVDSLEELRDRENGA